MADFLIHPDLDYKAGPWRSYFVAAELEGERYATELVTQLTNQINAKTSIQHTVRSSSLDSAGINERCNFGGFDARNTYKLKCSYL